MIHFFRNVVKFMLLVIAIVIISVLAMYYVVIRDFQPLYESTTSMLVGRHPDDAAEYEAYVMLQEVMISEKVVHDIPELVFGTRVREEVNNVLAEELPAASSFNKETFRKSVETEIVLYSRVVNVSVRHPKAEGARLVAETIALTTAELMQEITGQDFIHIISSAEKPDRTTGLGVWHLWGLSVLGGILLGMAVVFLVTLSEQEAVSSAESKMTGKGKKGPLPNLLFENKNESRESSD